MSSLAWAFSWGCGAAVVPFPRPSAPLAFLVRLPASGLQQPEGIASFGLAVLPGPSERVPHQGGGEHPSAPVSFSRGRPHVNKHPRRPQEPRCPASRTASGLLVPGLPAAQRARATGLHLVSDAKRVTVTPPTPCLHTHRHSQTHTQALTHTHTKAHTYIHRDVHAWTYIHTQTHTKAHTQLLGTKGRTDNDG